MGGDKIRHLRPKPLSDGRVAWYWQPSATVRALGLSPEALGFDAAAARRRAIELNALADDVRIGRKGRALGPAPGTVARLIADYRASPEWLALKPRTRRDYDRWIDRFRDGFVAGEVTFDGFGDLPAAAISARVLKVWKRSIDGATGAYEGYHALGTMRALWAWAEGEEWVAASPARLVRNQRPKKRAVQWTLEQQTAFIAASGLCGQPGLGVAMMVNDNIGQSPVDVFDLRARHFDGATLRPDGRAKTGVGNVAFRLWPEVAAALSAYLALRPAPHPDAPLFVNDLTGRRWEESRRGKEFRRVRAAAGLPAHLQFQGLRRSAATEAGEAGATAFEVQAMLRHTSPSEAATYVIAGSALVESLSEKRRKHRRGES